MRTLSAALLAALASTVTKPGFLVKIGFATPIYLSSRGAVTYDGHTYTAADIELTGLGADPKGDQRGTLRIGNTDLAIGVIILNEQNADWDITVYVFDAAATATADIVEIFNGTGNGAALDERWASIDLTSGSTSTQFLPAEYITAEQGFSFLPPAGMRIATPAGIYTLEPSRV